MISRGDSGSREEALRGAGSCKISAAPGCRRVDAKLVPEVRPVEIPGAGVRFFDVPVIH
jgi:hypothetical protein